MRDSWFLIKRCLGLCLFSFLMSVCSAPRDASAPGACSLSCGNAKIGSNDMRIRFLTAPIEAACLGVTPGDPYPQPIPIHFIVEKDEPTLPSGSSTTGSNNSTTSSDSIATSVSPVSGVSFEPTVVGGLTGPENPDDPSGRYNGIITSQDEWCTDSCGLGLIEVVPLCFTDENLVTLQVHSGAAVANTTITVKSGN